MSNVDDLLAEFIEKEPNETKEPEKPKENGPKFSINAAEMLEVLKQIRKPVFSTKEIEENLEFAGYDIGELVMNTVLHSLAEQGVIYGQGESFFSLEEVINSDIIAAQDNNLDNLNSLLTETPKTSENSDPLSELLSEPPKKTSIFEDTSATKTIETKNVDTFDLEESLGVKLEEKSLTTTEVVSKEESNALTLIDAKELDGYKKSRLMVWTPENIPKQFMHIYSGIDKDTGKRIDNPHILKAGLLWLGNQVGVKRVTPYPLINSWDDNNKEGKAYCKAEVETKDGKIFTAYRVAIPDGKNVKMKTMFPHIDAFAETRAICAALRLATNCGFVAAEELPDYEGPLN